MPGNVLIIKNFLDDQVIAELRDFADGEIGKIAKVEVDQGDGRLAVLRHEGFSSDRIDANKIEGTALGICDRIFGEVIPGHYGDEIDYYEYPHILRYRKGGNYKPHSDADYWDEDRNEWVRNVDRDYSAVLYFNDEFEGGSLYFTRLDYRLSPEAGMLVCFPSGGLYEHTAEPVVTGSRYALVTWAAAKGAARVFSTPRGEVRYIDERMQRSAS